MAARVSTRSGLPLTTTRRGTVSAGHKGKQVTRAEQAQPHDQVIAIQRSRLLAAAVRTVDELGYNRTTVAHITRRARVSRRTFYELFRNCDECLLAVLDDTLQGIRGELAATRVGRSPWREQIRTGLFVILAFLDREPALARVCVVQTLRGGPMMLERREQTLAELVAVVHRGRAQGTRGAGCSPVVAEALVGAACGVVYTRLLKGEGTPLSELLGELMGLIVLPYLGPAAARRERARTDSVASHQTRGNAAAPGEVVNGGLGGVEDAAADPLEGLAMRITYRTARVLQGIAEQPGASNRQIAARAEIADQGQVSKLLARLERLGLLRNTVLGHGKGEPNAWILTTRGEQVAHSIRVHSHESNVEVGL